MDRTKSKLSNGDATGSAASSSLLPENNRMVKVVSSTTTTSDSSPVCLNNVSSSDRNGHHGGYVSSSSSSSHKSPRYGWCSFTPEFIQFLVNKKAFLFVFCITCVLQGTFHTYFVAVITTLEKLFSIPSQVTGTLMMGSEIGQVSSALLLPYFVGQGHRPRWMAIGSSLFAVATLLCASPHVLIPLSVKVKNTQDSQYCGASPTSALINNSSLSSSLSSSSSSVMNNSLIFPGMSPNDPCQAPPEDANPHFILFPIIFLSLLTIGLGQTAVYTLGIPFLDDNVASRDSPIYFSITIGVRILGPVLGFILGSLCTRLYIYPHITPEYDPTDPRWLGAWWLGMLLISGSLLITSIVMYGFPASLKRKQAINTEAQQSQEIHTIDAVVDERETTTGNRRRRSFSTSSSSSPPGLQSNLPKLRNFPHTIKRLLSNKILILRTFSCVFHLLPISGLYTFLPKYLESQFRLAAFQANMITGIAGILVMGIGIFSSGVFIRRKEPSAKGIAIWVAGAAGIYALGMVALMFVGCSVEGRGSGYSSAAPVSVSDFSIRNDGNFGLPNCVTDKCSKCSETVYAPVCGSDNRVYFSPCHAGCAANDAINVTNGAGGDKLMYTNCSCVEEASDSVSTEGEDWVGGTATKGMCPVSCDLFPLYLTIFMIIVLVHSTSEVGSMLLTLRCVEPRDKAMALGLIQCAIGIFGNVPCPVIYGTVVDSACIVWGSTGGTDKDCFDNNNSLISPNFTASGEIEGEEEVVSSAKRGHCWVYDSTSFRIYFHGTTALLMFVAFVIDLVVVYHAGAINMGTGPSDPRPPVVSDKVVKTDAMGMGVNKSERRREEDYEPESSPLLTNGEVVRTSTQGQSNSNCNEGSSTVVPS